MTDVLIIEDEQDIRQSLEYNLKEAGFTVTATGDGQVGLRLAKEVRPKLVLLDLLLPGKDGRLVCKELRAVDQQVHIIMITALGSEQDKVNGFALGADDYITKPFQMSELIARVKAQLRRAKETTSPAVTKVGDLVIDNPSFKVTVNGQPLVLRRKEFALLSFLAENQGALVNRAQLAEKIWGYDFLGSSRTIDVHIRRLRSKIEALSSYKYFHTVHGVGYRFEPVKKEE